MFKDALGHVIRAERTKKGYTLRQVATTSCMSLGYLCEIEKGKKEASSQIIERIAQSLDIKTSDLVHLTANLMSNFEQHRLDIDKAELELANV
jgi:transcriptional regulator with XRE-family HTH domain